MSELLDVPHLLFSGSTDRCWIRVDRASFPENQGQAYHTKRGMIILVNEGDGHASNLDSD